MFACLADFSLFLKIFVINRFLAVTFQNLAGILRGFPPLISATVRIQFDEVLFGERLKKCRFEVCFNFSADNDVTTSSWNYSEFFSSFGSIFLRDKNWYFTRIFLCTFVEIDRNYNLERLLLKAFQLQIYLPTYVKKYLLLVQNNTFGIVRYIYEVFFNIVTSYTRKYIQQEVKVEQKW